MDHKPTYYCLRTAASRLSETGRYGVQVGDVEPAGESPNVSLFPNPAQNELFISLDTQAKGDYALSIVDMNGKLVKLVKLTTGQNKVGIENIPNGVYLAKVGNNQIIAFKTKFVVVR
ncbi:MAG: T9SS type A sorting domain-containing protein [Saprospiraceae bacterium]|nr:T9SS type A sorting domain-containing protein [Saprospiraceae bacterium]